MMTMMLTTSTLFVSAKKTTEPSKDEIIAIYKTYDTEQSYEPDCQDEYVH